MLRKMKTLNCDVPLRMRDLTTLSLCQVVIAFEENELFIDGLESNRKKCDPTIVKP
jgi:hypothetical protein